MRSLNELKKEIVLVEGQRIKNRYTLDLGLYALISVGISILLYWILRALDIGAGFIPYINVWIGAMVGTWFLLGLESS